MKRIDFRVDNDMAERIGIIAANSCESRAAIVRYAIDALVGVTVDRDFVRRYRHAAIGHDANTKMSFTLTDQNYHRLNTLRGSLGLIAPMRMSALVRVALADFLPPLADLERLDHD